MSSPAYPELIAGILSATGGRHVHFGPLSVKRRRLIDASLAAAGVSRRQFVWIEHADTLLQGFRQHHVDLVINTYPRGGACAAVEIMAAGLPLLWHSPAPHLDSVRTQLTYPGAPVWRTLEELTGLLAAVDEPWLRCQGEAARSCYEERHHPRIWSGFFTGAAAGRGCDLPPGLEISCLTAEILEHALARRGEQQTELIRKHQAKHRPRPAWWARLGHLLRRRRTT
jgi:hypothetical protein